MSEINKSKNGHRLRVWLMPLLFFVFGLFITLLIHDKNIALFHPKGFMAQQQLHLMIFAGLLLLAGALPTLALLYFTAWKYRESNTKAVHDTHVFESKTVLLTMWAVPVVFAIVLASFMWPATHRLEPRKKLTGDAKPMTIQVISMRWKWVFLYPEQKIATVNFVQLPVNTPVTFELTGDEAPMSSFWIPNLGGQLYSMTSHVNSVNLMAETAGDYPGSSAEINGAGFSGMKFTARASSVDDFSRWVDQVKHSEETLDSDQYDQLLKPSENNPAAYYSAYDANLYDNVIKKYSASHEAHEDHEHHE